MPNTPPIWSVGDLNLIKVPSDLSDNQVLFLSDILATGWHATELGNVHDGDSVAIWGCGPGQSIWQFEGLDALVLPHISSIRVSSHIAVIAYLPHSSFVQLCSLML